MFDSSTTLSGLESVGISTEPTLQRISARLPHFEASGSALSLFLREYAVAKSQLAGNQRFEKSFTDQ